VGIVYPTPWKYLEMQVPWHGHMDIQWILTKTNRLLYVYGMPHMFAELSDISSPTANQLH
jgi:hypothetical protein